VLKREASQWSGPEGFLILGQGAATEIRALEGDRGAQLPGAICEPGCDRCSQ